MKHAMNRSGVLSTAMMLAALGACGGPKIASLDNQKGRGELLSVEVGRLVDIYSYRRVDASQGDRRLRANRRFELIATNVVVNASLESQSLFDAAGEVVPTASYEFMPFDKTVGHEQLLILWDNTPGGPEAANFDLALQVAQSNLGEVPASYRGQNTQSRPIPIVARNTALKLTFSNPMDTTPEFFTVNPSAIQLLEFKGDPTVVAPVDAFRILSCRVIPDGKAIILDTTILGGESTTTTSPGLPLSADSVTANIRIAIPTRGGVVSTFYVKEDKVAQLNGVDSSGRPAVIRDFRSGNLSDGVAGRMREPEAPSIVTSLGMGITAVDLTNNIITLNKRSQFVPVRGRYPFVDGPLRTNGIPLGPLSAPLQQPLTQGDILTQVVQVQTLPGVFENVLLRAEILENLEIATTVGTPGLGHPLATLPPVPVPGDQGELLPVIQVRVASVFAGKDSTGTLQPFQASPLPEGKDCVLRALYHEEIPYTNSGTLTDRDWRNLYLRIEPKPAQPTIDVQPNASVAIEFTKPMDLDQIDPTANLLITNRPTSAETFEQQMTDPKKAVTRIVPTRLSDLAGDGTVLRLQPPIGLFHAAGQAEAYAMHVRLGANGVTDLAGNPLEIFDNPSNPQSSWSVDFALAASAAANLVGYHTWPFEDDDEDGSLPGSVDIFGQFRRENGRLIGATGVRFGRSADQQNLSTISRINRGECWDPRNPTGTPPAPATGNSLVLPTLPVDQMNIAHPGLLYWNPRMSDTIVPPNQPVPTVFPYWQTVAQPVGRVVEPLKPQGSRMQMRYIEDDFSLSYRQPTDFGLDVEQLYWSTFNDEDVLFDVFDRFTMSLSHSRKRPDECWFLNFQPDPPECTLACASMNSGLSPVFADNVLEGTSPVPVFEDKIYRVNPNEAFRTTQGVKYVPFPRFDHTYTWRDSRLVTVDANGNVIGLGGAQQPGALPPNNDFTANVDSPWVPSVPLDNTVQPPVPDPEFFQAGFSTYVNDPADFIGSNQRDHDPIALPLLVDFKVFPDNPANGLAGGNNGFQVAMLGPPTYGFPLYGGYYDQWGAGCGGVPPWPHTRVHASGGFDLITGAAILIDPANQLVAQPSVVKDAGAVAFGGSQATGLMLAPAGDGMINWARADFVRKVSTATFGFIDTLTPQRNQLVDGSGVPQVPNNGIPDLTAINSNLRISDLVVQIDPPQARQPAGTSVVVEIRGAQSFANNNVLYNPSFAAPGIVPSDAFDTRGNLLNPNYACEAYRYSTPNTVTAIPRVAATGLTRYVTEDQLALIRDPATGLLPRFLNLRVVMTNNVGVSPALSPSLRSMSIVYRLTAP
jgi:hypothetical protein